MRSDVRKLLGFSLLGCLMMSSSILAGDLDFAPPSFAYKGKKAVAVDFQNVSISYVFDAATSKAAGFAKITFHADQPGYPIFDLVPEAKNLNFNGSSLENSALAEVSDPTNVTKLRVLNSEVAADSDHELTLEFELNGSDVTFQDGAVRVGFFMSDLVDGGREYFEQYGPANLEFDQYSLNVSVELKNVTKEHRLYANGEVTADGSQKWNIDFPSYYTTSSFYLHLVEKGRFVEQNFDFVGIEKTFPVTIYGPSASQVTNAVTQAKSVLAENEKTYGAFAHDRVIAYITPGGGGMEHCGATMTSNWALAHEFTHFWFARGVMPSDGNSGWIDEAVASWRDNGYPRTEREPSGIGINLSGFSPYKRETTTQAYGYGATIISHFDGMFSGVVVGEFSGMRAILRTFYGENKRETISIQSFKTALESMTDRDLTDIFNRYIMGQNLAPQEPSGFRVMQPSIFEAKNIPSHHPRPYTKAELEIYR